MHTNGGSSEYLCKWKFGFICIFTYAHIHLRFIDLHFMFVYIFNKEDVAL